MQKPGQRALRKGRYSQSNGIYLVTFVTDQRIPWFQDYELARIMCQKIVSPTLLAESDNLCYVVMFDHIHMLVRLGNEPLDRLINRLKSRSAAFLNMEIGRSGRFWGCGYHDHALRKEEDLLATARYIVANPVRAGLVSRVGDYPYWNAKWL